MDSQLEPAGDSREMETPEDVAVLYSWANLHGAKYRDFSASRREYRAQMRRRAAEKQREEELRAKAEAEAAAAAAEAEVKAAEAAASKADQMAAMDDKEQALYELHEAQRRAKAERIEAERRAEAAALAEADLLRAEREMADAHASAQRQAARYAESEQRRRQLAGPQPRVQVPGAISDPYTPEGQPAVEVEHHYHHPEVPGSQHSSRVQAARSLTREMRPAHTSEVGARRRPRSSADSYAEHMAAQERRAEFERADAARAREEERLALEERTAREAREAVEATRRPGDGLTPARREPSAEESRHIIAGRRDEGQRARPRGFHPDETSGEIAAYVRPQEQPAEMMPTRQFIPIPSMPPQQPVARQAEPERPRQESPRQPEPYRQEAPRQVEPYRAEPVRQPEAPVRREYKEPPRPDYVRQDYRRPGTGESRYMGASSRSSIRLPDDLLERMGSVRPAGSEPLTPAQPQEPGPVGPAWLYPEQEERERERRPMERSGLHRSRQDYTRPPERTGAAASPIDDTLQQSRERVAARWYALKGVFEGSAPEAQPEPQPVRKELRTPVVAVFSLVGGAGRTSLVATLGRALSSMGEKVLLMDTSAHSLLPFYFGASELRSGKVRTFSPPSGSTDAAISCVSYDLDQSGGDQAAQDWLTEELTRNSRGMQRMLLDLSGNAGWVARRLARMNPTVLVPVAPDMNSVISLQSVERFFAGVTDGEGRLVQPYFLLNQFDASLPLHLDVREVLRRQLGDRLLPFVIRRAPAVSEALAEGMTVVDYAPDAAVSSDYMNVATWLRSIAAPATAGFRNLRWSER